MPWNRRSGGGSSWQESNWDQEESWQREYPEYPIQESTWSASWAKQEKRVLWACGECRACLSLQVELLHTGEATTAALTRNITHTRRIVHTKHIFESIDMLNHCIHVDYIRCSPCFISFIYIFHFTHPSQSELFQPKCEASMTSTGDTADTPYKCRKHTHVRHFHPGISLASLFLVAMPGAPNSVLVPCNCIDNHSDT